MNKYKKLTIQGTLLEKRQLENYLEKVASSHNVINTSEKQTYPIPQLIESFKVIEELYMLLNEHLKLGISIHPAGEWILDNFYIIEETVKYIQKELTMNKYKNLVGISNGEYKGFARVYVLAGEIVAYSDNKIEMQNLEDFLKSYQTKKILNMDEIWNVGLFLQICIINNIAELSAKIYSSQIEKYKAENIAERLIEKKEKINTKFSNKKIEKEIFQDMKYSFIEYMSYILKRYGKKGTSYLSALEEIVEKLGVSISEIIKKEHFEMAIQKVLIGNCIISIKEIQRTNFLTMFEKINSIEEILKQDPAEVYIKMDFKTKEYYRQRIKEISKKTKTSEIYIAKKILELSKKNTKEKMNHIGFYLINDIGINVLYKELRVETKSNYLLKFKPQIYIFTISMFTILLSLCLSYIVGFYIKSSIINIISFIVFLIPSSEIVIQTIQYILSKIVKPKIIPKVDFLNGIDKENSCFVVIPTILNSKEKTIEMIEKLEKFYLANKSDNLYFALLGDCTQSTIKNDKIDEEIIYTGKKEIEKLNLKYRNSIFPIFSFFYRERQWNEKENSYLGWERKRGLLNQFNEYVLYQKNPFLTNTIQENIEDKKIEILKNIKYVITLDADTDLILNSGLELVGAMAHILNKPVIDEKKKIVIDGYGIMQPRVGINLDASFKTLFTKIFAGDAGVDIYASAVSDIYQDNFGEGIFTGKGIYDLKVFSKIMKNVIPENTVLSHDLLEGSYLRCGLVTDVMLMDGYPTKYQSFIDRLSRWIRGDWQILKWLSKKKNLNILSRYKIFDNLRRSVYEISIIILLIYANIIRYYYSIKMDIIILFILIFPFVLQVLNYIFKIKKGEEKQKNFTNQVLGLKGVALRCFLTIGTLPYKEYISFFAIIKTLYRLLITKRNLLEWTTSDEAERQVKNTFLSYLKNMIINIIFGTLFIVMFFYDHSILTLTIGILWLIIPSITWYISQENKQKNKIELLDKQEQEFILKVGKRTWGFFEEYLKEENNYLIPDNYQEDRKDKIVNRTSSTNIGLSLLAVISASDLGYIEIEKAIELISNIVNTIDSLEKWNGHLYNWYNIKTRKPLNPKYVSTVDSGNFVGYLYVLKSWLEENKEKINNTILEKIEKIIIDSDFSKLYSNEKRVFSIGFNIEENKLTNSYYDLLASEARQASFIAIAKKDVPEKHWNSLSRTLTTLGKYKGLISWSGTAFEYLMPNINIPKYKGSLLDESCRFMIMSQMQYAKKLQIPWGISESAFNLKDLYSNYQYKAFGIPWLGLKRGLEEEMVVSPYSSFLAITDYPKEVYQNINRLKDYGMFNKYGFFESIDFTPERLKKGEKNSIVKTYMAHHQGLILVSINNLINNNIIQTRFMTNPEMKAIEILLQERMPETAIITKERKEKIEKIKYIDYEDYIKKTYNKIDNRIIRSNVISNENYTIAMNQKGEGISIYKNKFINRFKNTDDYSQGIFFNIKNIRTEKIYKFNFNEKQNYKISFMPDKIEQEIVDDKIKSKIETIIVPDEPVEIRRLTIQNISNTEELFEIYSYFEPILSSKEQDYAHPTFNNLFLKFDYDNKTKSIIIKRNKRENDEKELYMACTLCFDEEDESGLEYEIDKEKFIRKRKL